MNLWGVIHLSTGEQTHLEQKTETSCRNPAYFPFPSIHLWKYSKLVCRIVGFCSLWLLEGTSESSSGCNKPSCYFDIDLLLFASPINHLYQHVEEKC